MRVTSYTQSGTCIGSNVGAFALSTSSPCRVARASEVAPQARNSRRVAPSGWSVRFIRPRLATSPVSAGGSADRGADEDIVTGMRTDGDAEAAELQEARKV